MLRVLVGSLGTSGALGQAAAASHLFGLLFPSLLLGEELQVKLLLLLLVIFLKLGDKVGDSQPAGAASCQCARPPEQNLGWAGRRGARPSLVFPASWRSSCPGPRTESHVLALCPPWSCRDGSGASPGGMGG